MSSPRVFGPVGLLGPGVLLLACAGSTATDEVEESPASMGGDTTGPDDSPSKGEGGSGGRVSPSMSGGAESGGSNSDADGGEASPGGSTGGQVSVPSGGHGTGAADGSGGANSGGSGGATAEECPAEHYRAMPGADCLPFTECPEGTRVESEPSPTSDRVCVACLSGTFSGVTNSTSCSPWLDCTDNHYVKEQGTASSDRQCAICEGDSTTTSPNQTVCDAPDACPAGTFETVPGTAITAPECAACSPGEYCAGGNTAAELCPLAWWDDDGNPATPCIEASHCLAGSRESTAPTSTTDRACEPCAEGEFTTQIDQTECQPFQDCDPGEQIVHPGSKTEDRTCEGCPDGTFSDTSNAASCSDHSSCSAVGLGVYVAGTKTRDASCSRYEWVQQQWVPEMQASANAVAVTPDGNVVVTGIAEDRFDVTTPPHHAVLFLSQYSSLGERQWTSYRRTYTNYRDSNGGIVASPSGDLFAAAALQESSGAFVDLDMTLNKFDSAGNYQWRERRGSSLMSDEPYDVALDSNGNIYVAWDEVTGLDSNESTASLSMYSSAGVHQWTKSLGANAVGRGRSVVVAPDDSIYFTGSYYVDDPEEPAGSRWEGFVAQYFSDGSEGWFDWVGEQATVEDSVVDSSGNVYVVMEGYSTVVRKYAPDGTRLWSKPMTASSLELSELALQSDDRVIVGGRRIPAEGSRFAPFLMALDSDGNEVWSVLVGTDEGGEPRSLAVDAAGSLYVAGGTSGAFPGGPPENADVRSTFLMKLRPQE